VPIGYPIANKQVYLLDARCQPVPVGVPGQIYVGGEGLSRGYLDDPELTAERFTPNPFASEPGARLYQTGDLARYLPDGRIEYLGRVDEQVKIRGLRVELGEIEHVLGRHPSVRESVVVVREDASGDRRLAAYLVHQNAPVPTHAELRDYLREHLPPHMVPASYVVLERLPRTPNGKLDRQSLPEANGFHQLESAVAYLEPQTDAERVIAETWQETLGREKVGLNDNFFDLGGHSLLMLRVHSKLRERLKLEMSIVDMFSYPTVSALAERLRSEPEQTPSFAQHEERAAASVQAMKRRRRLRKEREVAGD
jgi:long-subunit acyl-CoA synthetase (AMP-forming)